ncbi:MAG TPA: YdeI/OmpD-associated family protein [Cyclobacteriaceae bacterium]|nr:YdeI/OmpD-associated family protein [Cyclobacteriaceae bacterium]
MHSFTASLEIIGVNPFVSVPDEILTRIFEQAGRDKGPIPIAGKVNGASYRQTLVRYRGAWRLYVNTTMLKNSPQRIGEVLSITVTYDRKSRTVAPPKAFLTALNANKKAKATFDQLPPSRKHEIVRYLAHLKTEESRMRNIKRAIAFLLGKEGFVGRKKP